MEDFPPVSNELISALEKAFPQCHPRPETPVNVIMFRAGQREVIEYLRAVHRTRAEQEMA